MSNQPEVAVELRDTLQPEWGIRRELALADLGLQHPEYQDLYVRYGRSERRDSKLGVRFNEAVQEIDKVLDRLFEANVELGLADELPIETNVELGLANEL
jgi:hypothetical protein